MDIPPRAQYMFAYVNEAHNPNPTTRLPLSALPLLSTSRRTSILPPFSPTATPIPRTPAAARCPNCHPHLHLTGEHRWQLSTLVIPLTLTQPATAAQGPSGTKVMTSVEEFQAVCDRGTSNMVEIRCASGKSKHCLGSSASTRIQRRWLDLVCWGALVAGSWGMACYLATGSQSVS